MTDHMTTEELKACRERAEAATPGPWGFKIGNLKAYVFSLDDGEDLGFSLQLQHWKDGRDVPSAENAAFIAHARQDVPRMLATIDKLREDAAADEWQPIEMAPEDEGLVQVWDSFENLPVVARFDGMHWISEETGRELAPTHYRRLPKSPFAPNGAGQ